MNNYGRDRKPFFFIVDFLANQPIIIATENLEKENIHFQFPGAGTSTSPGSSKNINLKKEIPSINSYSNSFKKIMEHLNYGNSYLVNLTSQTKIDLPASLYEVYQEANAPYKILFRDEWVCFSPECFIKIKDGLISSYPMKGTIDSSIPGAEKIILNDEKEMAEHYTIVDLIRNDLAIVSENVEVTKFRYVDTIKTNNKTLLQVSSEITGKMPADYLDHLGDIICHLLPAGSVTGAPKKKTVEIIREVENYNRGYYTGVAGYFNGIDLDSCVLIRFIEKTESGYVYKSGGGITLFSDVEKEFQEMLDKIYVPVA